MSGKQFETFEIKIKVMPAGTVIGTFGSPYLPAVDNVVEYLDVETQVTTAYEVKKVIFEVEEIAAIPPAGEDPGSPARHLLGLTIEVMV